nr:MAG TPA: hypothetical protein [Caudoviricetes sp.]
MTIPPTRPLVVPPPFTQGRLVLAGFLCGALTPHPPPFGGPLFLPKTGPFCRRCRHFPRARGNYLKGKA